MIACMAHGSHQFRRLQEDRANVCHLGLRQAHLHQWICNCFPLKHLSSGSDSDCWRPTLRLRREEVCRLVVPETVPPVRLGLLKAWQVSGASVPVSVLVPPWGLPRATLAHIRRLM